MKYCDLHNHTMYSDGSDTPQKLCALAKEKGIDALAITDHNTINGIFEFEKCAKEIGLDYILGSELTTQHNGKEVHIIAMFINENNAHGVVNFIENVQKIKRESNVRLAKMLTQDGYNFSLSELENRFGKNINRAHFAKVMIEMGIVSSIEEAFDGILKEGNGYYSVAKRPDTLKTISDIVSWGCIPVLAHPLLSFDEKALEEFLPQAKKAGLVSMEAYYSKFSKEQTEYLLALCAKHDLIPSGGSDYHGDIKKTVILGSANAPYSCYERLKAHLINNQLSQ